METKKWITEREQTTVKKSFHGGWEGTTYVKVKGYCYMIHTGKTDRGMIHSYAMQIEDRGRSGGFTSIMFNPLTAKQYELGKVPMLGSEKNIRELHFKALSDFDQMTDKLPEKADAYKIVVGQVVFLNGYGQDEYSHERELIYKIDEDKYYTVNEKTLTFRSDDLAHLKDIKEKNGIGHYYKQGDKVHVEFINNLVIDAHEKIKRDEAERPAREAAEREEKARQTAEIEAAYPYLLKETERGGGVHVAKNIRIELKRLFPDIDFKVRSEYSSVNIYWNNGPTKAQISAITSKYEDHESDVTGDFRDYKPSLFNRIFGGCNFVFENRHITDEVFEIFFQWSKQRFSDTTNDDELKRRAYSHCHETDIPDYFPFVLQWNDEKKDFIPTPETSIPEDQETEEFYLDPNQLSLF